MKKRHMLAITALLAAVLAGGIAAYLQDRDNKVNLFNFASEQTEVVEKYEPPKKLTAGVTFPKEVQVQNNGNIPVYVRVMAVFTNEDVDQYTSLDYNTSDWVYDRTDGYWYYKYALEPGSLTSPLFRQVSISADADESQIRDFEIIVYHESCYDNGYSSYTQAWQTYLENLEKPTPSSLAVYSNGARMVDGKVSVSAGQSISKSLFLTQAVLSDGTRYDLSESEFSISPATAPTTAGNFDVTVSANINGRAITGKIPCVAQNFVSWTLASKGTYGFVKDSGDRWKSDNYYVSNSEATATFTVNLPRQVTDYTFTYEVSSESGWDKFTVILDGETIASQISGQSGEKSCTKTLSAGTHTIQVTYKKDSSGNYYDDRGYITLPDIRF